MFFKHKKQQEEEVFEGINQRIDLTLLDPRAVLRDVQTLINVAVKNNYRAICVNPDKVAEARDYMENKLKIILPIVSVVGFPLGSHTIQTKVTEAKQAIADGADELDVVINIGRAKEEDYAYVKQELSRIVRIAKGKIVKAIIESCYLNREQIKNVCRMCVKAKVDYIMTSTGYGTGGATVEDVQLIKETVQNRCQIKASGGVRNRPFAEELVRAGATLIGTSRVI